MRANSRPVYRYATSSTHVNVDTTSCDIVRRRIDVETTSCVYGAAPIRTYKVKVYNL